MENKTNIIDFLKRFFSFKNVKFLIIAYILFHFLCLLFVNGETITIKFSVKKIFTTKKQNSLVSIKKDKADQHYKPKLK